jgi:hypothetical protein
MEKGHKKHEKTQKTETSLLDYVSVFRAFSCFSWLIHRAAVTVESLNVPGLNGNFLLAYLG